MVRQRARRLLFGPQSHLIGAQVSPAPASQRSWRFVAQCWLAVDKDDGRVERTLRLRPQGGGFTQVLPPTLHPQALVLEPSLWKRCIHVASLQRFWLQLADYLADYHIWMSVLGCPHPNAFTPTQRLGVSLLLLLGHAAANSAIVSQLEDPVGQVPLPLLLPVLVANHPLRFRSCPLMWA